MNTDALNDFVKISDVDTLLIHEYKDVLPQEIITVWKNYGFGSFMNGYLKVINPNDFIKLLEESYFLANVSIPIFTTAFGDVITWRENRFMDIVLYRYGKNDVMLEGMDFFFDDLRLIVLIALWFLERARTAGTHLRSGLAAENLRV